MKKIGLILLGAFLLLSLATAFTAQAAPAPTVQAPFSDWAQETPNPLGISILKDIIHVNGTYVAVGYNGYVATSTDGLTWTQRSTGTTSVYFEAIAYGNNMYVAVGMSGVIYSSPDLSTWTAQTSGTTNTLNSIAYGAGGFIAVGASGTQLASTDGQTWTSVNSGTVYTGTVVKYLNNLWIICYNNIVGCRTSTNGTTWNTTIVNSPSGIISIAYGNGKYVLGGSSRDTFVITSSFADNSFTNSASKFSVTGGSMPRTVDLTYYDGKFVGIDVNNRQLLTSTDGSNVTATSLGISNISGLVLNSTAHVFVTGSGNTYYRSTDLLNWTPLNAGYSQSLKKVAAGTNQSLVAIGTQIMNIKQGSNPWVDGRKGVTDIDTSYNAIIYQDGQYMAVGPGLKRWISSNGSDWTFYNTASANTSDVFTEVIYDGSKYIAAGGASSALLYTSTDRMTWTQVTTPPPTTSGGISFMAYGNGKYVALRNGDSVVFESSNMITWTSRSVGAQNIGLKFINNYFYVTTTTGQIYRSSDAVTWTSINVSSTASPQVKTIAFGNNMFLAATSNGKVFYSRTFTNNWTELPVTIVHSSQTTSNFSDSVFVDGKFYVVGSNGVTFSGSAPMAWPVTYNGNTNTGGSVPAEKYFAQNETVTVASNSGNLAKTNFVFSGWNTAADGSGTAYAANSTFTMGTTPVVLFAQWVPANQAPTNITLSSTSIAENAGANAVVGTFSATDVNAGDSFTYSLVNGTGSTDNGSFNISGTSLRAYANFDFETKSSYSVRVRVTDSGSLTFEKAFTITVTNVNEAPINIILSKLTVDENVGANAVVGSLTATDPDAGDTATFSLVSGAGSTDNASFNINGSSLRSNTSFDFETKSSYSVRVRVTDSGGATYEKSFAITVTNVEDAAPSTPTALTASKVTHNSITVSWTASTDDIGVVAYNVFRNGLYVRSVAGTSITITGLTPLSTHQITVQAYDAVRNKSARSTALSVTTAPPSDAIAPSTPTGLTTSNLTGTSVIVRWTASTDNVGVTGYNVYVNGVYNKTVTNPATTITGLANITSYTVAVQALDAAKNRSGISAPISFTTLDSTGPTAPAALTSSDVTKTSVRVSWTASTDNVGVTFYNLYRNGVYVATVNAATTSYTFRGLMAGTSYDLTVRALDAARNFTNSTPLSVTTTN